MHCPYSSGANCRYPTFGMGLPGRKFSSGSEYRFGFNGKENDQETKTLDYGARIYDTRIAKFLSVDAIANKFPWWSPYAFAGNTPIQALDLDGYEILNYKTPYRLKMSSGESALSNKTEIHYSWSDDAEVANGMIKTATDISYGLAGKNYNPPLPTMYPIYPGTGEDQEYYTATADELNQLDNFGIGSPKGLQASDASSNSTDGLAADRKKGERYVTTNRNKTRNDKGAAGAGALEYAMTELFKKSNTMRSVKAKADVNNIINAYRLATKLVDDELDFSEIGKQMNWTNEQVNQYKADIINYVVDGKLPNSQTQEYNSAVETNGIRVITSNPEADSKKPLNSDGN